MQLNDDQQTVSGYGLRAGSTVILLISATPVTFQVFVMNDKGQLTAYDITDDETTDHLKTRVSQREGIPVDQLRLIHKGQELQTGKMLQDYNIARENTIYMVLRLRGGCWDEDI